jgi:hypothetical protein
VGWRRLMREDEPYSIRRRFMTTVSHAVQGAPPGIVLDATGDFILGLPPDTVATARAVLVNLPNQAAHVTDTSSLMDWPVLTRTSFPNISDNLRAQVIDLNMTDSANAAQAKADFIRYCAAAMYRAYESELYRFDQLPESARRVLIVANPKAGSASRREHSPVPFIHAWAEYKGLAYAPTTIERTDGRLHAMIPAGYYTAREIFTA